MRGSLVIATKDRADVVARSVRHIRGLLPDQWELIVVDDGTTPSLSRRSLGDARLLRLDESVGRGAARNYGAAHAVGDILAFMDDDIFPERGCLDRLVRLVEDSVVWAAPVERVLDQPRVSDASQAPEVAEARLRETQIVSSVLLVTRRASFEAVGGFPTDITRLVDYEISLRARMKGHTLVQDEGAVVVHEDFHHSFRAICLREHDSISLLPLVWSLHFPVPPGPEEVYFEWFWGNYRSRWWLIRAVARMLQSEPLWTVYRRLLPSRRPRPDVLARFLFRICAVRGAFHGFGLVSSDYRDRLREIEVRLKAEVEPHR
jgi:glycosyltransferase involved in cell wall biosynthesis